MGHYFRGSARHHLLGLLGGIIWCVAALSYFTAATAPRAASVSPAISYATSQGGALLGALWGLLYWKEFQGAPSRANTLVVVTLLLFAAGLGLVSLAPA